MKQYQSNAISLITIISKIQESCIHLFLIYSFGQLQDISPKNFTFLKTFNSELSYIEVWFTDHNFKPLEIEIKENITLVINQIVKYKK